MNAATELPDNIPEPTLTEELLETITGRHEFLMKWIVIKAVAAVGLMLFCIWQFFQQDSPMAMLAYATAILLCAIGYAAVVTFFWIRLNHNTTIREIKRLELQMALMARQAQQREHA